MILPTTQVALSFCSRIHWFLKDPATPHALPSFLAYHARIFIVTGCRAPTVKGHRLFIPCTESLSKYEALPHFWRQQPVLMEVGWGDGNNISSPHRIKWVHCPSANSSGQAQSQWGLEISHSEKNLQVVHRPQQPLVTLFWKDGTSLFAGFWAPWWEVAWKLMCPPFMGLGGHSALSQLFIQTQSQWEIWGSPSDKITSGTGLCILLTWIWEDGISAGHGSCCWCPADCTTYTAPQYRQYCTVYTALLSVDFPLKTSNCPLGMHFLPCSSGIFPWSISVRIFSIQPNLLLFSAFY